MLETIAFIYHMLLIIYKYLNILPEAALDITNHQVCEAVLKKEKEEREGE